MRSFIGLLITLAATGAAAARAQLPTPYAAAAADSAWRIEPAEHADLWFHAMAVIGADEPGPLGLYSAEYAQAIRDAKREAGVYPTLLDREAQSLRRQLADSTLQNLHFLPLFFEDATVEHMLEAVKAAATGRSPRTLGPETPAGIATLAFVAQDADGRRLLQRLEHVVREEWESFYREYWRDFRAQRAEQYAAMQDLWDAHLAGPLARFLERRRLTAGLVIPSPPLGPEGRITQESEFIPDDQVVAVQFPPSATGPEASVFAFLKELCFLLIDDSMLLHGAPEESDLEDLQRRAAVRCGGLILQFHAPELAARYRRVFLDAVGAKESATVHAFERIYPLPSPVHVELREAIRQR